MCSCRPEEPIGAGHSHGSFAEMGCRSSGSRRSLGVPSSAFGWTRDIDLTEEQRERNLAVREGPQDPSASPTRRGDRAVSRAPPSRLSGRGAPTSARADDGRCTKRVHALLGGGLARNGTAVRFCNSDREMVAVLQTVPRRSASTYRHEFRLSLARLPRATGSRCSEIEDRWLSPWTSPSLHRGSISSIRCQPPAVEQAEQAPVRGRAPLGSTTHPSCSTSTGRFRSTPGSRSLAGLTGRHAERR